MQPSSADPTAGSASVGSETVVDAGIRAFAVVRYQNHTWVVDLPPDRWLDIGRAETAHIRVDSKDVATTHGQLHWDQRRITFRTASRAATFVNGKKHSGPTELMPGDEVTLGPVQLVIGIAAPPNGSLRRVLTHHEFRERLWEETARAYRGGRQTTLVMVQAKSGEGGRIAATALQSFRAGDVVGAFAPDELEFLLPDTSAELARTVVARILATSGVPAAAGLVVAPDDGDHPERLIRAARKALKSARDSRSGTDSVAVGRAVEPVSVDAVSQRLLADIERVAATEERVLFSGEIGTGKRSHARLLHDKSSRRDAPLVMYRCTAYGAANKHGDELVQAFEQAKGGTLVLLDISELPADEQKILLRLASAHQKSSRLLSTTFRNLAPLVARGLFLDELYESLVDEILELPAVRERSADIIPMAKRFLQEFSGSESIRMGLGAMARLQSYSWPGNVVELRNAMERAALLASGGEVLAEHLPTDSLPSDSNEGRLREHVDSVERDAIIKALADTNHNQTHAAKRLGISRRALIYKLEKYGLKRPPGTIRKSTRKGQGSDGDSFD